jgi:hypothetical protein
MTACFIICLAILGFSQAVMLATAHKLIESSGFVVWLITFLLNCFITITLACALGQSC